MDDAAAPGGSGDPATPSLRGGSGRGEPVFASYQPAVQWLTDRVNYERIRPNRVDPKVFKLDRMRVLLAELGDPHRAFRSVHVAGSKGKGSVVEMAASMLGACGYTTGVYTSPHLVDLRERIRIGRDMIPYAAFAEIMGRCKRAADAMPREMVEEGGEATFFELMTCAAFCWFAEQAVDIAVVEVGLGGRLDCTNVLTPEVCGLTEIQLEHTQILGDTVEAIAAEKAGIMKPGIEAISVPQREEVLEVFRRRAAEAGATLSVLGRDIDFTQRFEASPDLGPHARVSVTSERSAYEHLPVPLKGEHQAHNCGLALALLDRLRARGFALPERDVARGLAAAPTTGRLEQVWDRPRIFVDGAHTAESIAALVRAAGAHLRYDSMVCVFGCAADKNIDGMLDEVGRGADKIIFTKSLSNPRACDPHELERRFGDERGKMAQVVPDLKDAINTAARAVGRDDIILITGSFYLAGDAKKLLQNQQKKQERAARRATEEAAGV